MSGRRLSVLSHLVPVALLSLLFAQLVFSIGMKSPTMDEQNHIARGLAYLKTGDLRLSKEHPPGINVWEAWPLLLDPGIHLPLDSPSWANGEWYGFADLLLWRVNDHPQEMVFAARVPVMWLTLLLAALTWRWAGELGGRWGAAMATTVLVFDPNILAHGRLTTTDMGVTLLTLATAYALWKADRQRRWTGWGWAGIALGGALLSKFSALTLVPVALLLAVATSLRERGFPTGALLGAKRAGLLLLTGGLVVWAGYRFTWGPTPLFGRASAPAPAYWSGIQAILQRTGSGTTAFLLGRYSERGWWYYFPLAFVLKTPLPTLILLSMAAWRAVGAMFKKDTALFFLLLPALSFWTLAIGSSFNIGYRHILPTLPLFYVTTGRFLCKPLRAGPDGQSRRSSARPTMRLATGVRALHLPTELKTGSIWLPLILALMAWLIADALLIAPHYLTFFNALAGGAEGGRRFLADSNLDWGQDLPSLKEYVEEHGIERVNLSWFGAAHPEAYGLRFHPLPGFWRFRGSPEEYGFNPLAPAAGVYAISVSNLQGIALVDRDTFAWFRGQKPAASIGHSILIYRVGESMGKGQAIALGMPRPEMTTCPALPRISSIRRYDPSSGIILPMADVIWFVAPERVKWGQEVYKGAGCAISRVRGKEFPAVGPSMGRCEYVTLCGAETAILQAASGQHLVQVRAWWRVELPPHRAAVSFAHLLDAQGHYVAGWDGLTAPATCWQAGDVIRQDYAIPAPPPGRYRIEVGWYNAEDGRRWKCESEGKVEGQLWLPDVNLPRRP